MDAPRHTGGFLAPALRIRGAGLRAQARGLEPDERLDGTAFQPTVKPTDETTADSGQEGLSQTQPLTEQSHEKEGHRLKKAGGEVFAY